MALSADEIRRIARLARLSLDRAEVERFRTDLSRILEYAEAIRGVPTDGIDPSPHVIDLANVWREDEPGACLGAEAATAGAPDAADGMFRVPQIIET